MNSHSPEITIPSDVLRKWQRIVDLLANIMHLPSAVMTKMEPPHFTYYRILVSSNSEGNPFPVDEIFSMDIGTFCETVIKNREPLLVTNALEDDQWKSAPEIGVGMVSSWDFPFPGPMAGCSEPSAFSTIRRIHTATSARRAYCIAAMSCKETCRPWPA